MSRLRYMAAPFCRSGTQRTRGFCAQCNTTTRRGAVKYNLPGKTAIIIDKSQQCNNLRLLLDKYPPAEIIDKDEAIDKKKDTKGAWLRSILANHINNTELAMAAYHRWYSFTSAL